VKWSEQESDRGQVQAENASRPETGASLVWFDYTGWVYRQVGFRKDYDRPLAIGGSRDIYLSRRVVV
jgi:hypothetical protein